MVADIEAFEAQRPRLTRLAYRMLGSVAEAEDVVQASYVSAFTKLGSFREDARFSTWITRIALNEALSRARRRRPQVLAGVLKKRRLRASLRSELILRGSIRYLICRARLA